MTNTTRQTRKEKEIDHLLSKMGKNGITRFKRKRPQKIRRTFSEIINLKCLLF